MPGVSTVATRPGQDMGKKKNTDALLRQVNIRVAHEVYDRIDAAAAGLGLDVANFLRMLIIENLAPYERRAAHIRQQREDE